VTFTGNRALMLEEPLIFEIGSADVTGVDFAEDRLPTTSAPWRARGADRPAGPERARDGAPLHAPVAPELRHRPRPVPARQLHDEA
jgi:hypothetical protein